jgi:uncharacterized protein (TIGR01319 family)
MAERGRGTPAFSSTTSMFIATDVGSTTTKVMLFVKEGGKWLFHRNEAPTTVEKPHEDVTIGVINAIRALEKDTGLALLADGAAAVPFLCTSSAGGGLAMVVTGLVRHLTAESADRAALGAGAIVLDVMAMNDGRTPYRKIEDLKRYRPDMVLLAGGFDGDNISGPVYLAELVVESGLHPKLDPDAKLDIVYAGNVNARDYVRGVFADDYEFHPVPNIRPSGDRERSDPARKQIHELFTNHVMSQAPGYERLKPWVASPIRPTPAAIANLLAVVSRELKQSIMVIDIGGATTDVFTAVDGNVFRTVSANLGMSYSIRNVAEAGGIGTIRDLAGSGLKEVDLWDRIGNKHLHPTSLPATPEDMKIEWAVATVALREAVANHLEVMRSDGDETTDTRPDLDVLIRGPRRQWERDLRPEGRLYLSLEEYGMVIGSGGILSHSPREAAAMVLIDALQPVGTVQLAVDSAFMFPHLGVLAEVDEALAKEIFFDLGLVDLGTLYAPAGQGSEAGVLLVRGETGSGSAMEATVGVEEISAIPLGDDGSFGIMTGDGAGGARVRVKGGVCGLIVDNRPRPVSKGAHVLLAGDYTPPARGVSEPFEARIHVGPIAMTRELAIPGDVFVTAGQTVETHTLVARSTRQFLRPFFIDVAGPLGIPPADTAKYLTKMVGDEIDYGEVIARRPRKVFSFDVVRSNVRATVERILPNGTVVARETPETAREYVTVNAARDIGKPGWQMRPYLRVEKGQEVERGQWLAAEISPHGVRYSASPTRGLVNRIDYGYGLVVIEPMLEELDVLAWLPGQVERTTERGCIVRGEGVLIHGVWGVGGEAVGPLTFGEAGRGKIVARDFTDAPALAELEAAGVAGVITGGVHLRDMIGAEPKFTIVVTEGFGATGLSAEVHRHIETHEGRLTLLDGTTQLRIGVKRPQIVLPAEQAG